MRNVRPRPAGSARRPRWADRMTRARPVRRVRDDASSGHRAGGQSAVGQRTADPVFHAERGRSAAVLARARPARARPTRYAGSRFARSRRSGPKARTVCGPGPRAPRPDGRPLPFERLAGEEVRQGLHGDQRAGPGREVRVRPRAQGAVHVPPPVDADRRLRSGEGTARGHRPHQRNTARTVPRHGLAVGRRDRGDRQPPVRPGAGPDQRGRPASSARSAAVPDPEPACSRAIRPTRRRASPGSSPGSPSTANTEPSRAAAASAPGAAGPVRAPRAASRPGSRPVASSVRRRSLRPTCRR